MVGILIIAHAPLASAFLTTLRHVFQDDPDNLKVIDVLPDQPTEDVILRARHAVMQLNTGDGVLVLTDISGATPANCSQQLETPGQVAVVAGLSLPMLLRALTYRTDKLDVVVSMAQAGAQSGAIRLNSES